MPFLHRSSDSPFVKSGAEAQLAHDALLAVKPENVVHEPCDLCPEVNATKEVAQVSGDNRTYPEAEHLALMADAVKRETAELTAVKASQETQISELTAKVDVLEAEKATLGAKQDETQAAFDAFKAEVERAREIETAKAARLEKVKAAKQLPDAYFTEERIQRWAEMTEEAFASLVEDLTAAAGATPVKETAAFSGGYSPTADGTVVSAGSIFAARRGDKN